MENKMDFKVMNVKHYTNQEFLNIIKNSMINEQYYKQNFGKNENGFYLAPQTQMLLDIELVNNMKRIVEGSKNQKKLELLNKVLNECLIVEKEPNQVEMGSYFIKKGSLSFEMTTAINNAGYKLEDKDYVENAINTKNNKDLELMSENE